MFPWRENRLLRKALALYAGDHVLAHVLRHREDAFYREGETHEITLMFIDVAAFTKPATEPSRDGIISLMLSWFEIISSAILSRGGVLDTYIGDAACAWWQSGGETPHPLAACECAKHIVAEIDELNARSRTNGLPEIKPGIGINTGSVRLGSYGSTRRLRYAAMGDPVNLASRLSSLANRDYPHPIVISESTNAYLGNRFSSTLLGTKRIVGDDKGVQLFAI